MCMSGHVLPLRHPPLLLKKGHILFPCSVALPSPGQESGARRPGERLRSFLCSFAAPALGDRLLNFPSGTRLERERERLVSRSTLGGRAMSVKRYALWPRWCLMTSVKVGNSFWRQLSIHLVRMWKSAFSRACTAAGSYGPSTALDMTHW